jgi:MSHA biogenesis protein MshI
VKIRWPFKKLTNQNWLGINLSQLNPSAVIYRAGNIVAAKSFSQEQGIEALGNWIRQHARAGMPAVLVLDSSDYELLLTEAPNVPDDELNAAMEFRVADLLAQDISATAIQTIRLPADAYRGRMSMAHVIASPNEKIEAWVSWAKELKLDISLITVPELCMLNLLALFDVEQGVGLLGLSSDKGSLRLYQAGALYLTRQIEVGLDALELVSAESQEETDEEDDNENFTLEAFDQIEDDSDELDLKLNDVEEQSAGELSLGDYVPFSGRPRVNEYQLENLILQVQRSLDYYESQLGMGQITRLMLLSDGTDLADLVEVMGDKLSVKIEQPDITKKFKEFNFYIADDITELNSTAVAIGGALAYDGS